MKLIAFGHRRRVGKDTAGKFLLGHLRTEKISSSRCSFGDEVKYVAYMMYKWAGLQPGIYYENHPKEKEQILPTLGKSPRDVWIELGQSANQIHPKTWIEPALLKIGTDVSIITDLRRLAEVDSVKQFKGICVKVVNERVEKFDDAVDGELENYTDWDDTIDNNGSLKELNVKVIQLYNKWFA